MKRNKSIIQVIKDPPEITWADIHIAKIKGEASVKRSITYKNLENDEIYTYLAGGVGWPGNGKPGFAVVLAVLEGDGKDPQFKAVDEVEAMDVQTLMDECLRLRRKWGYFEDAAIMSLWWGDYERFVTFTSEKNLKLADNVKSEKDGLYIIPPIEFERRNCFEIYLRRIKSCVEPGSKTLSFGDCGMLKNHLAVLPVDADKQRERQKAGNFPPVAALGFVLHSLCVVKPWERGAAEVASEFGLDIRELATIEQDQAIKELSQGDDDSIFHQIERPDAFEDYGTKNTIPGG